jgi:ADP-ribosylglycohydrolase
MWDEYNQHHWCHTISNAQVVTIALLWSGGEFESAVTKSVWPGFDTDCNGATVGSVMGMILGTAEGR